MKKENWLNAAGSKDILLLVSFLVLVLIALSAMAKADENHSNSVTGSLIAPDLTSTTLPAEPVLQIEESSSPTNSSSVEGSAQTEANETASEEFSDESSTTTTLILDFSNETTETTTTSLVSTVDESIVTTTVEEKEGQPLIETALSSEKVTRGHNFALQATLKNIGNATANITDIDFELPEGISIYSVDYGSCKSIEPGSECAFPAEFSINYSAKTGMEKIKIVVHYG